MKKIKLKYPNATLFICGGSWRCENRSISYEIADDNSPSLYDYDVSSRGISEHFKG